MEKLDRREAMKSLSAAGACNREHHGWGGRRPDSMQNVNWEEVNRRFVNARKMAALL
jgi:hypothetical protein